MRGIQIQIQIVLFVFVFPVAFVTAVTPNQWIVWNLGPQDYLLIEMLLIVDPS
ncbi:hypothetical protein P3342_011503 [Pyrenophora teres f. teres]|nr:hypothetical protein P3342_011503 [Pyrenophora teres f. teres]